MTKLGRLRRRFIGRIVAAAAYPLASQGVRPGMAATRRFRGLTSIEEFGCREGGDFDNVANFARATAEALTLLVPEGNYYTSKPVLLLKSGARLVGAGAEASKITAAPTASAAIQVGRGSDAPSHVSIEGLTVARAGGRPPEGSVGISWTSFNYGSEANVIVDNHYWGRLTTGPSPGALSIGYRGTGIYARNCTRAYFKVANAAGVYISNSEFGQNGGERYDPIFLVEISGGANDINLTDVSLVPRGPSPNRPTTVGFTDYVNSTGVFSFLNCDTENTAHAMSSDSQTRVITALKVIGGRYAPKGDFFDLSPRTSLLAAEFTGVDVGTGLTISAEKWLRLGSGTFVGGNLSIAGNGNDLQVVGAEITGVASLSGRFGRVVWVGSPAQAGFKDTCTAKTKRFVASPPAADQ
jgi:hypothetical protein